MNEGYGYGREGAGRGAGCRGRERGEKEWKEGKKSLHYLKATWLPYLKGSSSIPALVVRMQIARSKSNNRNHRILQQFSILFFVIFFFSKPSEFVLELADWDHATACQRMCAKEMSGEKRVPL